MKLKAIVFDLDGTLVDSKLNFDLMRDEIGIPQGEPILEFLERHPDPSFVTHAMNIVHQHELRGALSATVIDGVIELLQTIKSFKIPLGLLTRNSKEITDLTLSNLNLDFFDSVITRDCARPKPDPEGLIVMSKSWSLPPIDMIYIGDYGFDIETAKAAGCRAGLYAQKGLSPWEEQADVVIRNYREFLAHLPELL
jgi:HAD superfamily hydrolase (TIGR01509 family)